MNKVKFNAFGPMNNLTLDELCKKISNENVKLNINIFDAFYDINIKDKKGTRNKRIYLLTIKNIIYHIIPKKYMKYKLMTITGFQYLDNMHKFNPIVVAHIDYSALLRKALLSDNLLNKKTIVIPCFFHFIQSIV